MHRILNDSCRILVDHCIPRPIQLFLERIQEAKAKEKWSIPISLFKTYKLDNEVTIMKLKQKDSSDKML